MVALFTGDVTGNDAAAAAAAAVDDDVSAAACSQISLIVEYNTLSFTKTGYTVQPVLTRMSIARRRDDVTVASASTWSEMRGADDEEEEKEEGVGEESIGGGEGDRARAEEAASTDEFLVDVNEDTDDDTEGRKGDRGWEYARIEVTTGREKMQLYSPLSCNEISAHAREFPLCDECELAETVEDEGDNEAEGVVEGMGEGAVMPVDAAVRERRVVSRRTTEAETYVE